MYRKNKYRVVTNGRDYRVQKLNKFLWIKRWRFASNASFSRLCDADTSMRSHESLNQCLIDLQEEKCKEKWIPVKGD